MKLVVNGQTLDTESATLADLLSDLDIVAERCATALNSELVPRGERPSTALKEGDRIEILKAMQGG